MSDQYQQGQQMQYRPGMSIDDVSTEPSMPTSDPNFLKARIETNTIIQELKAQLQGKTRDAKGKYIKLGEPLMNNEGINVIISIVRCYVNPSTLFADLKREDIDEMSYGLSGDLRTSITSNMYEWEVKDLPLVKRAILDFIFMSLTRALGRGEAKSIGNLTTVQRTMVVPGENRSRIPFFRGRHD